MLSFWYLRLRDRLMETLSNRDAEEEGERVVDYALMLVLIALVVVVILTLVGHHVSVASSDVNSGVSG